MSTNHIPKPGQRPPDHEFATIFPMMDAAGTAQMAGDIKNHGLRDKIVLHDGKILDGRNRFAACAIAGVEPEYEFFDPRRHGRSALAFVVSKNLPRRHLTASQRAAVAAEMLPLFEREAKERQKDSGKTHAGNVAPKPAAPAPKPAAAKPAAKAAQIPGTNVRSFSGGAGSFSAPATKIAPPKAAPKPARGKAADQAGAAMGVSGRMVTDAKKVQQQAPKKHAEVKAGTKTLAKAKKETGMESTAVQDALGRIQQVCGKSLAEAIREGTRLKGGPKEIMAYAAETDEIMLKCRGLIESGWDLKRALKFKLHSIGRTHRLGDLLDRAAASGGAFTLDIDGWVVSVTKAK